MNLVVDVELKRTLKPDIDRLNEELERLGQSADGYLGDLLSYVLVNSGKRVRPALVFLASRLGPASIEQARTVALAVELIHIATLVHDDVIDKAAMRRGRKTVAAQDGVDAAVLLGDHVYTHAFERAAETGNPEILRLLARTTAIMCEGEIGQLKNRYRFDLSERDYFSFIEKKTASLFGTSARAGGVLAGVSPEVQTALEQFGFHIGVAFQIVDDVLDLTGDEAVVGKTLHTDLMNGKMTLPLIRYRDESLADGEKASFYADLNSPNGHLGDLIARLRDAGAVDYAEQVAGKHVQAALSRLEVLPSGPTKTLLTSLADVLLRRSS